jgi:hypothetical protein
MVLFSNVDSFACPSFNALELPACRCIVQAAFASVLLAAIRADAHAGIYLVAAVLASHSFYAACHLRRVIHASKLYTLPHGDSFRQVARIVRVHIAAQRKVLGEELEHQESSLFLTDDSAE